MMKSVNHDVYRLYITHHIPGHPSLHGWDTAALFGYKYPWSYPPAALGHMKPFQMAIQNLVSGFAYDIVDGGWEMYPTNSKVLTNSAPWSEVVTSVQNDQCDFWKENGMDQWGWQN